MLEAVRKYLEARASGKDASSAAVSAPFFVFVGDERYDAAKNELSGFLLDEVRALYPRDFRWHQNTPDTYFIDKLLGTDAYRLGRYDARSLLAAHRDAREAFAEERREILLY